MLEAGVVINPTTGDALEINGSGQIRANFDSRAVPLSVSMAIMWLKRENSGTISKISRP